LTDDFDALFGGRPRQSFTGRLGQPNRSAPDTTPTPPPVAEATAGSGPYKPYGYLPSNTVSEVCEVRGWVNGTEMPEGLVFQYRFLIQVGYVGDESLKLSFPDSVVLIEGKHLTDLRHKLSRRMASFIQQHHPRIWPLPPADEPIVDRIEVVRPGSPKING